MIGGGDINNHEFDVRKVQQKSEANVILARTSSADPGDTTTLNRKTKVRRKSRHWIRRIFSSKKAEVTVTEGDPDNTNENKLAFETQLKVNAEVDASSAEATSTIAQMSADDEVANPPQSKEEIFQNADEEYEDFFTRRQCKC